MPSFAFTMVGAGRPSGGGGRCLSAICDERALGHRGGLVKRWVKLRHLSPVLFLSMDGSKLREERFALFPAGDRLALLTDELQFAATRAKARRRPSSESKLVRDDATVAKQPGGCKCWRGALAPNTSVTLQTLRDEHPVRLDAAAAATIVARARLPTLGTAAPRFTAVDVRAECGASRPTRGQGRPPCGAVTCSSV